MMNSDFQFNLKNQPVAVKVAQEPATKILLMLGSQVTIATKHFNVINKKCL